MTMTPDKWEQAVACLKCGKADNTPDDMFPLEPGLWPEPCIHCGAMAVWVAEPRLKPETFSDMAPGWRL